MHLAAALKFLIEVIFDMYCYLILARFLLQLARADFYNPISQTLVKATNPLLLPLRKVIPGWGGLDIAALVLLFTLQLIKTCLLVFLLGADVPWVAYLLHTIRECASLIINFFFFAIIIQVLASWVAPGSHNPILMLLNQVTEPLMGPIRKILPNMGGIDFSPMVAILLLSFLQILLGI